ncbi:hypothetical protein D3C72_2544010 [compost metagenome]
MLRLQNNEVSIHADIEPAFTIVEQEMARRITAQQLRYGGRRNAMLFAAGPQRR